VVRISAFLGEDAAPGFVVAEAGAGETMEVGDEGEVVDVLGTSRSQART